MLGILRLLAAGRCSTTVSRRCSPLLVCWKGRDADVGRRNNTSKRSIVTQISPTTSLLRAAETDNEVYLIGTAHISDASANEITELIDLVKPQTVFIELDPARAAQLYHQNQDRFEEELQQAFQALFSQNKVPMKIPGVAERQLGDYIRALYRVLKRYGLVPGIDMLAAMKAAQRHQAQLVYGDQDSQVTLRELVSAITTTSSPSSFLMRAMTVPPPPEIQETLAQVRTGGIEALGDSVEKLKTREQAQIMVDWMDQAVPEVANVLIHRRNRFMVDKLRQQQQQQQGGSSRVVAVVGMAHVDGVEREWLDFSKPSTSSSSSSS